MPNIQYLICLGVNQRDKNTLERIVNDKILWKENNWSVTSIRSPFLLHLINPIGNWKSGTLFHFSLPFFTFLTNSQLIYVDQSIHVLGKFGQNYYYKSLGFDCSFRCKLGEQWVLIVDCDGSSSSSWQWLRWRWCEGIWLFRSTVR